VRAAGSIPVSRSTLSVTSSPGLGCLRVWRPKAAAIGTGSRCSSPPSPLALPTTSSVDEERLRSDAYPAPGSCKRATGSPRRPRGLEAEEAARAALRDPQFDPLEGQQAGHYDEAERNECADQDGARIAAMAKAAASAARAKKLAGRHPPRNDQIQNVVLTSFVACSGHHIPPVPPRETGMFETRSAWLQERRKS
jgi:hypothetical protein